MAEPIRCAWAGSEQMMRYHDEEWGVPVHDDRHFFQMLILEGAQAGLSWDTILKRRAGYIAAYDGFDPVVVAGYDEAKMESLLQDVGIIRNRAKVRASVQNAQRFLDIQQEFGSFDSYVWRFVGGAPIVGHLKSMNDIRATSTESDALSKDLRKRGFGFVGSTIIYAFMQATGLVNDHVVDCFRYKQLT